MNKINFNEPYLTGNELPYIQEVFQQKQFYGNGPFTKKCQTEIEQKISAKKALLTDSCTSALEICALLLRDYKKQQNVVLPSYTFSSTAAAFAKMGFEVIFAEINPKTMMLDLNDVAKKINSNTVAVITVHYGAHPSEVFDLKKLCESRELFLIEDAAQAYGSRFHNKALGTIGDFGCLSFHETKNIHAGLAGALLINDEKFFDRATYIWERGTNRQDVLKGLANKYSWVEIGGSYYPTELQAAFLLAQLESFDANRKERQAIYNSYYKSLLPLKEKGKLHYLNFPENFESNYHSFFVLFNSEEHCDQVRTYLAKNDVAAYIGYVPLHSSKVGQSMGYTAESLPVTEEAAKRVLRLPFHNNLSSGDLKRVTDLIFEGLEA
jgi:dTDP-4-amino-4,6-dideoxygalactose transaminase